MRSSPGLDFMINKKLEHADILRSQRQYDEAKAICEDLLVIDQQNSRILFLLGQICFGLDDFQQAENYLTQALIIYPDNWRVMTLLATVKTRLYYFDEAFELIEKARRLRPDQLSIKVGLAECYFERKEYEKAAKILRIVLKKDPHFRSARLLLADCYAQIDDTDASVRELRRLFEAGFRNMSVLSRLARLPFQDFSVDLTPLLQQFENSARVDRAKYRFVRAQSYHRMGRSEEAWEEVVAANEIRKPEHAKDWRGSRLDRETAADYARNSSNDLPSAASEADLPLSLFIFGISRSGKTTLERLASSLPGVVRGYESTIFGHATRRASERSGRAMFESGEFQHYLPHSRGQKFLEEYVALLKKAAGTSRVFTNTNPGLISKSTYLSYLIPRSRFVFLRRDEEDLMFRIYMTAYRTGNSYSYDIAWIKQYIDWYYEIVDVFLDRFPDICRVIRYEDMVDDPHGAINTVARLCNISGEPRSPPRIGDDRGVSKPYKAFIRDALLG